MAEEEGKKEDQFGFTPEGEALGYISLEEARVQAMEAARGDASYYGSRFQQVDLAHEVIRHDEEEGEDYYDIRLSFRPAGRYTGQPGGRAVHHRQAG